MNKPHPCDNCPSHEPFLGDCYGPTDKTPDDCPMFEKVNGRWQWREIEKEVEVRNAGS